MTEDLWNHRGIRIHRAERALIRLLKKGDRRSAAGVQSTGFSRVVRSLTARPD